MCGRKKVHPNSHLDHQGLQGVQDNLVVVCLWDLGDLCNLVPLPCLGHLAVLWFHLSQGHLYTEMERDKSEISVKNEQFVTSLETIRKRQGCRNCKSSWMLICVRVSFL